MRNLKVRPVWLATLAAVVAAAGATGIVAEAANAAPAAKPAQYSYPPRSAKFQRPKLKQGLLSVRGTKGSDKIALRLQAGQPDILQIDVGDDGSADFSFPRSAITKIVVNARAGDDAVRVDESNGAFTDSIPTTIDGGNGNDTIAGGKGVETLLGGAGNDTIDGNGGNDLALLGAGDDTFVWDPGDGSDTIEGQDGTDTMVFNGANAAEQVQLSANGSRLKFFRTQGNITMDTAGVERVDFNALGGAAGDSAADRVVVNATNGNDAIDVSGDAQIVKVSGLAPTTELLHSEANDRLDVNTLGGTDSVGFAGLAAGVIQHAVDGVLIP